MLKRILASPFVHVDETKLSIEGVDHYVWVLTDGIHVVFRLTETRETTLVQDMLDGYAGVLISDFYGGYDACRCRQQKCLVHLIRDLNDDLWKNPFNQEFEGFVSAVRDLLVPIMADVEKFGLKRWHLHRAHAACRAFLQDRNPGPGVQVRSYPEIPEAVYPLQRELVPLLGGGRHTLEQQHGGTGESASGRPEEDFRDFFQAGSGSVPAIAGHCETCRFQGKSFLAFLLSREKDIDQFREKKRPKVTAQVASARSDTDIPSETTTMEAVGDDLAVDEGIPVMGKDCRGRKCEMSERWADLRASTK